MIEALDDLDLTHQLCNALIALDLTHKRADLIIHLVQCAYTAGMVRGIDFSMDATKLREEADNIARRHLHAIEPQGNA